MAIGDGFMKTEIEGVRLMRRGSIDHEMEEWGRRRR